MGVLLGAGSDLGEAVAHALASSFAVALADATVASLMGCDNLSWKFDAAVLANFDVDFFMISRANLGRDLAQVLGEVRLSAG